MLALQQIYTDNRDFSSQLPYGDALAQAIAWLWTDEASYTEHYDFDMRGSIKMYELMTCVHFFVMAAVGRLPQVTIEGYIEDMQRTKGSWSYMDSNVIKTGYDRKGQAGYTFEAIRTDVVAAILWSAHVYCRFRGDLTESEKWKKGAAVLLQLLRDKLPLKPGAFAKTPLMKRLPDTLTAMANAWCEEEQAKREKEKKAAQKQQKQEQQPDADEAATVALRQQLEQSQGEAEQLRQEAEQLRQEAERLRQKTEELRQEVARLTEENELLSSTVEPLEPEGKARLTLLLALMRHDGADTKRHGRQTLAAQLLQAVTGLSPSTCKNFMTDEKQGAVAVKPADAQPLNELMEKLGMQLRL